ncbi:MAG: hypothetical protein AAF628_31280, partial [Planctomycetota bacterium]
ARHLGTAFGVLCLAEAGLRRAVGAPPSRVPRLADDRVALDVRAARGDPEVLRAAQHPDAAWPPLRAAAASSWVQTLAFALEINGRGTPELLDRVCAFGLADGLNPVLAQERIARGVALARDARDGRRGEHAPDADTRLREWFARADAPLVPVDVRPAPQPVAALAEWTVSAEHVAVGGGARGVRWRNTRFLRDEHRLDRWYARLGLAGASAMELTFAIDDSPPQAVLRIVLLKARRAYLPDQGEAVLDVFVDGRWLGSARADSTDVADVVFLWSGERIGSGEHRIRVALSDSSNTTLRVHAVRLERP